MKYNKECECCGHVVTAYTHVLNPSLIEALQKMLDYCDSHNGEGFPLANLMQDTYDDVDLRKKHEYQYNNFQKTQYFGLAENRQALRYPTDFLRAFLDGKAKCYERVASFGNQTIRFDHPARQTEKKLPALKYVREISNAYKKREEYQFERGFHKQSLFA